MVCWLVSHSFGIASELRCSPHAATESKSPRSHGGHGVATSMSARSPDDGFDCLVSLWCATSSRSNNGKVLQVSQRFETLGANVLEAAPNPRRIAPYSILLPLGWPLGAEAGAPPRSERTRQRLGQPSAPSAGIRGGLRNSGEVLMMVSSTPTLPRTFAPVASTTGKDIRAEWGFETQRTTQDGDAPTSHPIRLSLFQSGVLFVSL